MKPDLRSRPGLFVAAILAASLVSSRAAAQQESEAATRQYAAAVRFQNLESYDLAAAEWQKFLQQFPADPRAAKAQYNLGVCYYLDNKPDQAQAALQTVIQKSPNLDGIDSAHLYLGAAQFSQARAGNAAMFQAAADSFTTLVSKFPQSKHVPDALYYQGECFYLQGKKQESIPSYAQLAAKYPDHKFVPDALYALGVAQDETGQADAAGKTYDGFLARFPENPLANEVKMRRAETLFAQGQYAEAAKRFAALTAVPGFPLADFAMVRQADSLSRLKQHAEAAALYAALPEKYPQSKHLPEATMAGGTSYYLAGNFAEARKLLDRVVQSGGPSAPEAAHWIAQSLLKEHKPAEVLAIVDKVLPQAGESPFLPQLLLDRADAVYEIPERKKESVALYADLAAKHPKSPAAPQALYMAGFAARELGQYDDALKHSAAFLPAFPDHSLLPDVVHVMAESNLLAGRLDEAQKHYGQLLTKYPDHPDSQLWKVRQGLVLQVQKKHQEAITALEPVLGQIQNPDLLAEARFLIGSSRLELNQPEPAAKMLEASLAAQPKWLQADATLLALAHAYRQLGDLPRARATAQRVIAEFPASRLLDKAHYRLGEYAYLAGDFAAASAQYAELVQKWPQSPLVPFALHEQGCSQLSQKDANAAEQTLSQMLEKYPKHELVPRARYARGMARQQLGKHAEAIGDLEAMLAANPTAEEKANATFLIGLCRTELKQYDAAIASFRTLLDQTPGFSAADKALYQLAWALKLSGKEAEAADAFQQLAEKHPDSPLAAEALHNVGQFAYDTKDYVRATKTYYAAMTKAKGTELGEKAAYKYGWTFYHLKELDNAQKAFRYQLTTYPSGPLAKEAAFMEAECLFEQDKHEEALKAYEQLKDLPTEDYRVLSLLHAGQAAAKLGQWDRSLQFLARIPAEFPKASVLPEALYEQGWAQQNKGNLDQATALYEQVIGKTNREVAARAQFMLGEIQFEKKDHAGAISSFFKVAYGYSYPKWQAMATYEAGRCFEVLGKKEQALKQYRELVEKYPQSEKVPLANQRIQELKG
ncbi:MAG: tetratricopeptide repeat protein [Pirellulales bacterium]|nr:tetratricopeptide repeat protein [Pirellulales bacterium]